MQALDLEETPTNVSRPSDNTRTVRCLSHASSAKDEKEHKARNPAVSWTRREKWLTIISACLVCFVVGINATAILVSVEDIAAEFDVDIESFDYSAFLITAWNGGAAVMPLFVLPLMEDLGILPIYYTNYFVFVAFVATQAVAPNFATLIVSRVIAGACAGVLQNIADGIAADIWADDIWERSVSLSAYILALLGGVTIGPVIGGGIIPSLGWRWISYIQLILLAAIFPFVALTMKDSRAHMRQASKGNRAQRLKTALNETCLRAIRMLFTEFTVGTFTLLSSFAFGTVLIMTQSIPLVFSTLYGWPAWLTGVTQVSIFIGEIVGFVLCLFQDRFIYPRFGYRNRNGKRPEAVPEPHLYTAIPCCFFGLAAGYFVYGWTSYPNIHWILPNIGLFLIGIGIMAIVQAVSLYVTDCYVSHAASAVSAAAFGENTFGAFLPLAAQSMYNTLGFQWASSFLGFAGILLSMAPIVLVFAGPTIRARSKFAG